MTLAIMQLELPHVVVNIMSYIDTFLLCHIVATILYYIFKCIFTNFHYFKFTEIIIGITFWAEILFCRFIFWFVVDSTPFSCIFQPSNLKTLYLSITFVIITNFLVHMSVLFPPLELNEHFITSSRLIC